MNKRQKEQMNIHYQEQIGSRLINNLDGAVGFKIGYEIAFDLADVSNQRELLIAYCKYILDECNPQDVITIDVFLKEKSNL